MADPNPWNEGDFRGSQGGPTWFDDAVSGADRFLGGKNDAPPADPRLMQPSITGGSRQWTEEDYQNALRIYYSLPPDQQAAMGGPPAAPELSPGMANVNLQRGYVNPLLSQLGDAAAGRGPSQARDALREGTATNIATQFGAAATPSVGGAAQAALYANAQNNAAGAMQAGARQSAQLRAQEMTDARQQLGNVLNQQQGTNLHGLAIQTEREKANQQASVGAAGINAQIGEQNRGGLLDLWGKFWSDIRAKEDVRPLAAFESTIDSGPGYQAMPPDSSNPFAFKQYLADAPKAPVQPLQEQKAGILGNLFSDARSKERISQLEGALAERLPEGNEASAHDAEEAAAMRGVFDGARQLNANYDDTLRVAKQLGVLSASDLELVKPLSGADAESQRTAGAITDAHVAYPQLGEAHLNLEAKRAPPTARFPDLATEGGSREALGPVNPYSYRYKPEFAAATGEDTSQRAGIMAQDLARSPNPALRSAVVPTENGLAIDGRRAVSANLALSAGLDKRLRNIEGALSRPTRGLPLVAGNNYGATEAGNIDLNNRPHVRNADGSVSTVRSMGVNLDGKEVLLPTVSDDGRIMSDEDAINTYRRTGRHLGTYRSPSDSDAAARAIHEDQARMLTPLFLSR